MNKIAETAIDRLQRCILRQNTVLPSGEALFKCFDLVMLPLLINYGSKEREKCYVIGVFISTLLVSSEMLVKQPGFSSFWLRVIDVLCKFVAQGGSVGETTTERMKNLLLVMIVEKRFDMMTEISNQNILEATMTMLDSYCPDIRKELDLALNPPSPVKVEVKANEEIKEEVKEEVKEEANEEVKEEVNETANEEVTETANEEVTETANEEVNETANEEVNETANEEVNEIKQEEPNEQLIHVLPEQTLPVDECDDSLMNEEDSIIPAAPSSSILQSNTTETSSEQSEQPEQNNDSVEFVSENPLESTEDVEKTC